VIGRANRSKIGPLTREGSVTSLGREDAGSKGK